VLLHLTLSERGDKDENAKQKLGEDMSEIVITFCVIPKQKQKGKGCFYVDY
jgi:hypothetical protein